MSGPDEATHLELFSRSVAAGRGEERGDGGGLAAGRRLPWARSETRHVQFDGHRLAYRVTGEGPALVLLNLYRRPADMIQAQLLGHVCQVFQLYPLGYGYSDRVPGYAGEALAAQATAILDAHGADRFIVWGFSKGGAMAACIARATARAAGVICGAFSPFDRPTPAAVRRMDRRLRPDHPSRSLWAWVTRFDWLAEVRALTIPALFNWGSADRSQAKGLRAARHVLRGEAIDFVEYPGVGHEVGGDPALVAELVVPSVVEWAAARLGSTW